MSDTRRLLGLLGALLLASCTADPCSVATVQARLDGAAAGEEVLLPACVVDGRLRVERGVVLRGAGIGATRIRGGVDVLAATAPTTVSSLSVESPASVAVRVTGDGEFVLVDVDIALSRGVGVGVREVERGRIERVSIRGGVDAEAGLVLAPGAGPDVGSYGLVVDRSGAADDPIEAIDVHVAEAGPWGTLVASGFFRWRGGSVQTVTGVAVQIDGGEATIEDVDIRDLIQGLQPLPAYGLAIVDGRATLARLVIERGEGVGILAHASEVDLVGPRVMGHRLGGLFAQRGSAIVLEGGVLEGNGLAGVSLVGVQSASISDTRVAATELRRSILGETMPVEMGDGLFVTRPLGTVAVVRSTFEANARAGVLVDLGAVADLDRVSLDEVVVDSAGSALGAIAQAGGSVVPTGAWDLAVERRGAAVVNDPARSEPLDAAGAIGEGSLPRPAIDPVLDGS